MSPLTCFCVTFSAIRLTLLVTRDFFIFSAVKAGSALQRPGGLHGEDPPQPWAPLDPGTFRRWCRGETGLPFVDAAMRELASTGFMNNRGRQNTANLFSKARLGPAVCGMLACASWTADCFQPSVQLGLCHA